MSRTVASPVRNAQASKQGWTWPIDFSQYNRSPNLSDSERAALDHAATCWERRQGQRLRKEWVQVSLQRLAQPLDTLFARYGSPDRSTWYNAKKAILWESLKQGQAYWGWDQQTWFELVDTGCSGWSTKIHPRYSGWSKIIYAAYIIGRVRNWVPCSKFSNDKLCYTAFACQLFGRDTVDAAADDLFADLVNWGYSIKPAGPTSPSHAQLDLRRAISVAFLYKGIPDLTEITLHDLEELRASCLPMHRNTLFPSLGLLSRVLYERHIIQNRLPTANELRRTDWATRQDRTSIPDEWFEVVALWHETSGLKARDHLAGLVLKVGRWLTVHHPDVTHPKQFSYQLAAELTAYICHEWKIGDYISPSEVKRMSRRAGQPISLKTSKSFLDALRAFFWDLQEEPFSIHLGFNPRKAFRTPKVVRDGIGPRPRTVENRLWARIVHAALNLTDEDVPRSNNGGVQYPLEMVAAVAVTWVFSGLRADEIARLPVGCIQRYDDDHVVPWTGEVLPKDAVVKLTVPVHKTGPSFPKPVHSIIFKRIKAWEAVRPEQPKQRDAKTGEMIDYLFSCRGSAMANSYINTSIIPMLSRKVIGESRKNRDEEQPNLRQISRLADAKGPLTSHRARAQIASMLHNSDVPMTLPEIQKWLGHRSLNSTVCYAETDLLTGNVAYANAEMFDRNLRMIQVYVDLDDNAGESRLYYDVGDGLCSYPEWHSCPHRMACLKCQYFVPKDIAVQVRARDSVRRFLEVIPDLSDTERRAVDGDEQALSELVERNEKMPPPAANPHFHRPLPVLNGAKPRRRS